MQMNLTCRYRSHSFFSHLKEAGGARGSLARHFELALAELVYELSFELVELWLVPSGAAVNHVDF